MSLVDGLSSLQAACANLALRGRKAEKDGPSLPGAEAVRANLLLQTLQEGEGSEFPGLGNGTHAKDRKSVPNVSMSGN